MDSQAAGVQVLIVMEKLSWGVRSDCRFAKQFLSVEMDWTLVTKAHQKIKSVNPMERTADSLSA